MCSMPSSPTAPVLLPPSCVRACLCVHGGKGPASATWSRDSFPFVRTSRALGWRTLALANPRHACPACHVSSILSTRDEHARCQGLTHTNTLKWTGMDARVCHEMLFVAVLTHKHTHTVCHEMLFVAVFAYSLGIAAIFGWFLPTINQSGFSQVCLLLPSLWDPLPASSRGRLASSRERLASPRSSPQPASPSLLRALPGVGMPRGRALPLCQMANSVVGQQVVACREWADLE